MKKLLLALCFLAIGLSLFSQKTACPLDRSEFEIFSQKLLEARRNAPTTDRGTKYIAVKFFDVTNLTGDGRLDDRYYIDLLCELNTIFSPAGVRFYLIDDKINQISDDLATKDQSGVGGLTLKAAADSTVLNIYTVSDIKLQNNMPYTLTVFGYTGKNRLLISKAFANIPSADVAHFIGHNFYLNHTCHGWEDSFWPAGSSACAPAQNQFGHPTEKADGSNGDTAGDLILDTPPDYNFIFDDPNCTDGYTGLARDPDCVPLAGLVDVHNAMNLNSPCPPYSITIGQGDAILTMLATPEFQNLGNSYFPPAESIMPPPDFLLEPTTNQQLPFNNQFFFKWETVADATFYLLDIAETDDFGSSIIYSKMTQTTELNITDLTVPSGKKLYWRVTPYNSYATCTVPPPGRKFFSGLFAVAAGEADDNDFSVKTFPNPAVLGEKTWLEITAPTILKAEIELTDPTGKILFFEKNWSIPEGLSVRELSFPEATAGVIFLKIKTGIGTAVQKLVLQKSQ